jgi:uncharacterized protein
MTTSVTKTVLKPRLLMFRWAGWFMLVNAILLMLVSLRYLKSMPFPDEALARAFLGLSYPGHFISLALYVFPLVAVGILAYPRRGFIFALSMALEICLVLAVIIDSMVFAQYRFHLNGMIWNLLTSGAAGEVLPVTGKLWLVLSFAVLLLTGLEWLIALFCWRWVQKQRRHVGIGGAAAIVIVVVAAHGMHAWADANNDTSITSQVRYLPAYKPLTMKRLLVKMGLAAEGERGELKLATGQSALKYPLEKITFGGDVRKRMNLLVIVIESWRFDTMTPEITPNIWDFSQQSWSFDNHFSSGNCTRFGIFGLLYGLYGTYWHAALAEERSPVLMQELEKRSYRMGVYGSAPLVNPEFDRTVFADLRNKIALHTDGGSPARNDRLITDKMVDFISKNRAGTPFFGFMFYDSPHSAEHPADRTPFRPSLKEVNYLALNNDYDPVPFFNKYKNSLNYVDSLVKEVLASLEKGKLLDDTIVVITGDHAQEFNDLKLNYWGHCGNFSRFQTQTPMVVRLPGKKAEKLSHLTSHLDLAPTLMKVMFGCTTDPAKYSNGRYLWDSSPRPFTLISSWDTFSINEQDRITVTESTGQIQVLDQRYREIKGATIRPEVSRDAMEGMGRFFAR